MFEINLAFKMKRRRSEKVIDDNIYGAWETRVFRRNDDFNEFVIKRFKYRFLHKAKNFYRSYERYIK